ncbi:MAG: hypothetical protein ACI4MV_01460 [Christensenellales bacterium]
MLSSKHRVLTIVLVLMIVAIVGTMVLSACQIKQNTPPDDKDKVETPKDEQDSTPDTEQDTNQDTDQDADNDQDATQEPPAQEKTEAECKAMFLEQLPTVIENYYNVNLAKFSTFNISNIKINTLNFSNGTIYINCIQQNVNKFMELKCDSIIDASSYQYLYKSLQTFVFTTKNNKGVTVQTEALANEIAEFALEQPQVQAYLAENGLTTTELIVLNATEFELTSKGNISTLTIKFNEYIFTVKIGGTTGACSTQEEYLNKLKDGRLSVLEDFALIPYQELAVG